MGLSSTLKSSFEIPPLLVAFTANVSDVPSATLLLLSGAIKTTDGACATAVGSILPMGALQASDAPASINKAIAAQEIIRPGINIPIRSTRHLHCRAHISQIPDIFAP